LLDVLWSTENTGKKKQSSFQHLQHFAFILKSKNAVSFCFCRKTDQSNEPITLPFALTKD